MGGGRRRRRRIRDEGRQDDDDCQIPRVNEWLNDRANQLLKSWRMGRLCTGNGNETGTVDMQRDLVVKILRGFSCSSKSAIVNS